MTFLGGGMAEPLRTAIYTEDTARVRVEVISDEHVGDKRVAVLKCIEQIEGHPFGEDWAPGVTRIVDAVTQYQAYCWGLEYES